MAEDFYPFVENGGASGADPSALVPRHPARIAVYDDNSAAPRVVVVEPQDVRPYLEEITLQVTQLSQAQGGTIPFMVIREIVENLIHAYFIEPTVSILNHGNTIRFSDQGPGIRQKERAMQYGTTSASEEMRRYIRGVGSGLPYVKQYMTDKGGSLSIEDNMAGGTVVTLSAVAVDASTAQPVMPGMTQQQGGWPQAPWQQQGYPQQQGWQQQPNWPNQPWQGAWQHQESPSQAPWQQGYPQQQGWPPQPWQQGMPQQQGWPAQQINMPQPSAGQPQPWQQQPEQPQTQPDRSATASEFSWVNLSQRGGEVLQYLRSHESVGPSDLARTLGGSQPTWTRELQALEDQGLVRKEGQKRRLTSMGRAYLQQL